MYGLGYFLVFVDDYSRMSWVYLQKERIRVSAVIKNFINEIKTQFSTTSILYNDIALEYTKKKYLIFMHLMGYYTKLFVYTLHSRMG